jgi:tetratricopeptide (TPR) repeat protein
MQLWYPKDIELARKAREACPLRSEVAFWLGKALASTDMVAAIDVYEQALELSPDDGEGWIEIGALYRASEQLELALEAYARACDFRFRLGCVSGGALAEIMGLTDFATEFKRRAEE